MPSGLYILTTRIQALDSEAIILHKLSGGKVLCNIDCPLKACIGDGTSGEINAFLWHTDGHRIPVFLKLNSINDSDGRCFEAFLHVML